MILLGTEIWTSKLISSEKWNANAIGKPSVIKSCFLKRWDGKLSLSWTDLGSQQSIWLSDCWEIPVCVTVHGSPLLLLLGSDLVPSSVDEEKGKRWVEAVALCLALTSPADSLKQFSRAEVPLAHGGFKHGLTWRHSDLGKGPYSTPVRQACKTEHSEASALEQTAARLCSPGWEGLLTPIYFLSLLI